MPRPFDKKSFEISERDARRIVNALEFDASWDKTEIYYKLKDWLESDKEVSAIPET